MSKFNIEEYETVDERIHKFWEMYPDGAILTDVFTETRSDGRVEWIAKCSIRKTHDGAIVATGWASEYEGANKFAPTNACELADTSSIGRALASLGLSKVGKRASREEMETARSKKATPKPMPQDDPWAKGMEILGDALAAQPIDPDAIMPRILSTKYSCPHGDMEYKTGVSKKTGKPWAGYFCADKIQSCETKWQKVG